MRDLSPADRLTLACLGAAIAGLLALAGASGMNARAKQKPPQPCSEVRR